MKNFETVQKLLAKLEKGHEPDGELSFPTLRSQQLALKEAKKYYDKLAAHRPKTPEDAAFWDELLVEAKKKIKRIEKAGVAFEQVKFSSQAEKDEALASIDLLRIRLQEAPIVPEEKE